MSKRQNVQVLVNDYNSLKQQHARALQHIAGVHRAAEETIEEFTKRAEEEIKKVQFDLSLALARLDQFEPHNDRVVEGIIQAAIQDEIAHDWSADDKNRGDIHYFLRAVNEIGHAANQQLYFNIVTDGKDGPPNPVFSDEAQADITTHIYRLAAVALRWLQERESRVAPKLHDPANNIFNGEKAVAFTPSRANSSTSVDGYDPDMDAIYEGDDEPSLIDEVAIIDSWPDEHPKD